MPRVNIVFVSAPINATYPISLDSALDHSALNCPLKSVFSGTASFRMGAETSRKSVGMVNTVERRLAA